MTSLGEPLVRFLIGLAAVALSCAMDVAVSHPTTRSWRFIVQLDDEPVGEHTFTITAHGGHTEVRTRARFAVKALFIPVFRYEHENDEVWRDGCLAAIRARTKRNGEETLVAGEHQASGFEVRRPEKQERLPTCVRTYAYWDPAIVHATRLLNPQTGNYDAVSIERVGGELLDVAGERVATERYRIRSQKYHIDLWYSPAGEWLGLESSLPEGRTLRYRLLR